jgi:RNA recognition motif-containing protein
LYRYAEDVDELTLKGVFDRFGNVESCCVIRDVSTNSSRGFGFVKFDHVHHAEAAIQHMHGKLVRGRVLEVGRGVCVCRVVLFSPPRLLLYHPFAKRKQT